MKRLSKYAISEICILARKGASLKEISSKLGFAKSTVQYHVAKVKGKRTREKALMIERLTQKELGWLVGCYAGDGSRVFRKKTYAYEVKFALNEKEYPIVKFVETILLKCGMKTWRSYQGPRVYVRCLSKKLFKFMEKYLMWDGRKKSLSVRLHSISYPNDFLFGFLCGLIDSDGGTKKLYISTSSRCLAHNIQEICNALGIFTKTHDYGVYHIYLRKDDFQKVCQEYEFSAVKHK